jgi:hypothetical protein
MKQLSINPRSPHPISTMWGMMWMKILETHHQDYMDDVEIEAIRSTDALLVRRHTQSLLL